MAINPNTELAQRLQERYDFYLIALTFTILGLSIQTANFDEHIASGVFELLSWVTFLFSGLVGLSRLELIPQLFNAHAELQESENEVVRLRNAETQGVTDVPLIDDERETAPINEVITNHETFVLNSKPVVEKLNNSTLIRYNIHKWSLVAGLALLIIARAIEPFTNIMKVLCNHT
jgi:hypothetical protein